MTGGIMKLLLQLHLLIGLLLSLKLVTAGEICLEAFSKDSKNHYYVGISDGLKSLEEAKAAARSNAIAEAIKHNFSYDLKINQSTYSNNNGVSAVTSSSSNLPKISTIGITTADFSYEMKDDRSYLVCLKIRYPIAAIKMSKSQHSSSRSYMNQYGAKHHHGSIIVETTPMDSHIELTSLGSKLSIEGTGPAEIHAPLGKYILTISNHGFLVDQKEVLITAKQQEHYIVLQKANGILDIETTPMNATVEVNGLAINNRQIRLLSNKEYSIKVSHADYLSQTQSVIIKEGKTKELSIELMGKDGSIKIIPSIYNASVMIDGKDHGQISGKRINLEPGFHNFEASYTGFVSTTRYVEIKPNRDSPPLSLPLEMAPRTYTPVTDPSPTTYTSGVARSPNSIKRTAKYYIGYQPFRYDEKDKEFLTDISFNLEYFHYKNLSVTVEYVRQLWRTEKVQNQSEIKFDSDHVTYGARIYLYRGKYLSLGAGYEYHTYRLEKTWHEQDIKQKEVYEAYGHGPNAVLSVPIYRDPTFGFTVEMQAVYREFHLQGERRKQGSIGISFGF